MNTTKIPFCELDSVFPHLGHSSTQRIPHVPFDVAENAQPLTISQPSGQHISVQTLGRKKILTGRVASYYQKQMAQESIRKTDPESHIVNQIEVVRSN